MSNFPVDPNKKKENNSQPLNGFMRSVNHFLQEKPVKNFLQQMDEFFNNPFPHAAFPVTVHETDNYSIIKAELAGINKEQIQLDVYDHYLTISVHYQDVITEEDTNTNTFYSSRTLRKNARSISLSHRINEKNIKASYQNGLLTIKVPKQKGRKIIIED